MNMTTLILFGSFVLFLVLGCPYRSRSALLAGQLFLLRYSHRHDRTAPVHGHGLVPAHGHPAVHSRRQPDDAGGISRKIVDFANILTGRVRGGLAYTAILACAIFAALSGSGPPRPSPSAR